MKEKKFDKDLLEEVKNYWNNHVHDWQVAKSKPGTKEFFEEIEIYRFEKLHYLPLIVDFNGYPGQKILDVGCGVGNDLSRFSRGGADVFGIDLAEHSIELARTNFSQRGLNGQFEVMDGERMQFADNSFNLVYCHTVLHFTPSPQYMVNEIYRVLKPGGQAIIMTVNRHSWLNILHKIMRVKIDHLDAPVFRQYTVKEFRQLLGSFATVNIILERFPVRTKAHTGIKAKLYNKLFVDFFNVLPRQWVRGSGHHLIGFVSKAIV